jgi:hypothetical protein
MPENHYKTPRPDLSTPAGSSPEQQFRRIIGYRNLATLVIAIERRTIATATPNNAQRPDTLQPVTV